MNAVQDIVFETALLALKLGLGLSLLAGLFMLVAPQQAVALTQLLGRRRSLRRQTRALELPHVSERFFYRYHRVFGVLIVLLALLILFYLGFRFNAQVVIGAFSAGQADIAVEITVKTFELLMWIGAAAAVVVGAVVFVRPSLLKGLEHYSNHWFSTRQATRGLATPLVDVDRLFEAYPRLTGALICAGSAAVLVGLCLSVG